jgi:hypothetical protein
MLPSQSLQNVSPAGSTHQGLLDDVDTRAQQTVRVGGQAGKQNAGARSVVLGYQAGSGAKALSQSVVAGYQSGTAATRLEDAVMVGAFTGTQAVGCTQTTVVGFRAGELMRGTTQSVGVGAFTLRESTAVKSTAVGYRAMERSLDAGYNTAVGAESMQNLRSGVHNTAQGYQSMRNALDTVESTAVGAFSGSSNTRGSGFTAVGYRSMEAASNAAGATAIGTCSLQMGKSAVDAVVVGARAARSAPSVDGTVVIGAGAASHVAATDCVIIGIDAVSNASVQTNATVAIGPGVARTLRSGNSNVFIGVGADAASASVSGGISIGTINTTTSTNSVSIGRYVRNTRVSSVMVGVNLESDTDNSVIMGNDITTQAVLSFVDPVTAASSNQAIASAAERFGAKSVSYSQLLSDVATNIPHPVARAGYRSLSGFRSWTAATGANLADTYPADFVLSKYGPDAGYLLIQGTVAAQLQDIEPGWAVNIVGQSASLSYGTIISPSLGGAWTSREDWSFSMPLSPTATVNVWGIGTSTVTYPYYIVKRAALPAFSAALCNLAVNLESTWVANGSVPYENLVFDAGVTALNNPPPIVVYELVSTSMTGAWLPQLGQFAPAPEAAFAAKHEVQLQPNLQIGTPGQPITGLARSNSSCLFTLTPSARTALVAHGLTPLAFSNGLPLSRDLLTFAPAPSADCRIGLAMDGAYELRTPAGEASNITYADLLAGTALLYSRTSNPAPIQLQFNDDAEAGYPINKDQLFRIDVDPLLPDTYWCNLSPLLSVPTPPASNVLLPSPIALPEATVVFEAFQRGSLSNMYYVPYHPWASGGDDTTLLLTNAAGGSQVTRVTMQQPANNFQVVPTAPWTFAPFTRPMVQLGYALLSLDDSTLISLKDTTVLNTSNYVNGLLVGQNTTTTSIPVTTYSSNRGVVSTTCNLATELFTTSTFPNLSDYNMSNVNSYRFDLSNYYYDIDSSTIARSNVTSTSDVLTSFSPIGAETFVGNADGVTVNFSSNIALAIDEMPYSYDDIATTFVSQLYTSHNVYTCNLDGTYTRLYSSNQSVYSAASLTLPPVKTSIHGRTAAQGVQIRLTTCNVSSFVDEQTVIPAVPWTSTSHWYAPGPTNNIMLRVDPPQSTPFILSNVGPVAAWGFGDSNVYLSPSLLGVGTRLIASNVATGQDVASDALIVQPVTVPLSAMRVVRLAGGKVNLDASFRLTATDIVGVLLQQAWSAAQQYGNSSAWTEVVWLSTGKGRIIDNNNVVTSIPFNPRGSQQFPTAYFIPDVPNWSVISDGYAVEWRLYFKGTSDQSIVIDLSFSLGRPRIFNTAPVLVNTAFSAFPTGALSLRVVQPRSSSTINDWNLSSGWTLCNGNVALQFNQLAPDTIDLLASASNYEFHPPPGNNNTNGVFEYIASGLFKVPLIAYTHNAWPLLGSLSNASNAAVFEELGTRPFSASVTGPFFDYMLRSNLYIGARQANADIIKALRVEVVRPGRVGQSALVHASHAGSNLRSFALQDVLDCNVRVVPFDAMALSNETLTVRWTYGGLASPPVPLALVSRIARVWPRTADPTRVDIADRTLNPVGDLWVSPSLPGYAWSPTTFTLPFDPSAGDTTLLVTLSNAAGHVLATASRVLKGLASSTPPAWRVASPTFEVSIDQADSVRLNTVIFPSAVQRTNAREVLYYVVSAPTKGLVIELPSGLPAVRFTQAQLDAGTVAYQHLGALEPHDSFALRIASGQYDVSVDTATVRVTVRQMPLVTTIRRAYVYDTNPETAVVPRQWSDTALGFDGAGGYVHVLGSNFMSATTPTMPISDIVNGAAKYNLQSTLFSADVSASAAYPDISLTFAVNATSSVGHVNPLATNAATSNAYRQLFVRTFEVRLNTYEARDERLAGAQPSAEQAIEYVVDNALASAINLKTRAVGWYVEFQAQSTVPVPPTNLADFSSVRDFRFALQATDALGSDVLKLQVTSSSLVYTAYNQPALTVPLATPFALDAFHSLYLVNADPSNNNFASLYVNYNFDDSQDDNDTRNVWLGAEVPIALFNTAHKLRWVTNLEDPLMQPTLSFAQIQGVRVMYKLDNCGTVLNVRNLQILIGTSELAVGGAPVPYDVATYNIAFGKGINVRGVRNIAFGSGFSASGQDSIIIGNDIGRVTSGASRTGTNDLFKSIIVGANSFRNAAVRNMVAVGTNNFNDIEDTDQEMLRNFMAREPIIMGNGIGRQMLDFHINVGNAFLKTEVGAKGTVNPQVYLGVTGETVGVGYSSNAALDKGIAQLWVNGAVHATQFISSSGTIIGGGGGGDSSVDDKLLNYLNNTFVGKATVTQIGAITTRGQVTHRLNIYGNAYQYAYEVKFNAIGSGLSILTLSGTTTNGVVQLQNTLAVGCYNMRVVVDASNVQGQVGTAPLTVDPAASFCVFATDNIGVPFVTMGSPTFSSTTVMYSGLPYYASNTSMYFVSNTIGFSNTYETVDPGSSNTVLRLGNSVDAATSLFAFCNVFTNWKINNTATTTSNTITLVVPMASAVNALLHYNASVYNLYNDFGGMGAPGSRFPFTCNIAYVGDPTTNEVTWQMRNKSAQAMVTATRKAVLSVNGNDWPSNIGTFNSNQLAAHDAFFSPLSTTFYSQSSNATDWAQATYRPIIPAGSVIPGTHSNLLFGFTTGVPENAFQLQLQPAAGGGATIHDVQIQWPSFGGGRTNFRSALVPVASAGVQADPNAPVGRYNVKAGQSLMPGEVLVNVQFRGTLVRQDIGLYTLTESIGVPGVGLARLRAPVVSGNAFYISGLPYYSLNTSVAFPAGALEFVNMYNLNDPGGTTNALQLSNDTLLPVTQSPYTFDQVFYDTSTSTSYFENSTTNCNVPTITLVNATSDLVSIYGKAFNIANAFPDAARVSTLLAAGIAYWPGAVMESGMQVITLIPANLGRTRRLAILALTDWSKNAWLMTPSTQVKVSQFDAFYSPYDASFRTSATIPWRTAQFRPQDAIGVGTGNHDYLFVGVSIDVGQTPLYSFVLTCADTVDSVSVKWGNGSIYDAFVVTPVGFRNDVTTSTSNIYVKAPLNELANVSATGVANAVTYDVLLRFKFRSSLPTNTLTLAPILNDIIQSPTVALAGATVCSQLTNSLLYVSGLPYYTSGAVATFPPSSLAFTNMYNTVYPTGTVMRLSSTATSASCNVASVFANIRENSATNAFAVNLALTDQVNAAVPIIGTACNVSGAGVATSLITTAYTTAGAPGVTETFWTMSHAAALVTATRLTVNETSSSSFTLARFSSVTSYNTIPTPSMALSDAIYSPYDSTFYSALASTGWNACSDRPARSLTSAVRSNLAFEFPNADPLMYAFRLDFSPPLAASTISDIWVYSQSLASSYAAIATLTPAGFTNISNSTYYVKFQRPSLALASDIVRLMVRFQGSIARSSISLSSIPTDGSFQSAPTLSVITATSNITGSTLYVSGLPYFTGATVVTYNAATFRFGNFFNVLTPSGNVLELTHSIAPARASTAFSTSSVFNNYSTYTMNDKAIQVALMQNYVATAPAVVSAVAYRNNTTPSAVSSPLALSTVAFFYSATASQLETHRRSVTSVAANGVPSVTVHSWNASAVSAYDAILSPYDDTLYNSVANTAWNGAAFPSGGGVASGASRLHYAFRCVAAAPLTGVLVTLQTSGAANIAVFVAWQVTASPTYTAFVEATYRSGTSYDAVPVAGIARTSELYVCIRFTGTLSKDCYSVAALPDNAALLPTVVRNAGVAVLASASSGGAAPVLSVSGLNYYTGSLTVTFPVSALAFTNIYQYDEPPPNILQITDSLANAIQYPLNDVFVSYRTSTSANTIAVNYQVTANTGLKALSGQAFNFSHTANTAVSLLTTLPYVASSINETTGYVSTILGAVSASERIVQQDYSMIAFTGLSSSSTILYPNAMYDPFSGVLVADRSRLTWNSATLKPAPSFSMAQTSTSVYVTKLTLFPRTVLYSFNISIAREADTAITSMYVRWDYADPSRFYNIALRFDNGGCGRSSLNAIETVGNNIIFKIQAPFQGNSSLYNSVSPSTTYMHVAFTFTGTMSPRFTIYSATVG